MRWGCQSILLAYGLMAVESATATPPPSKPAAVAIATSRNRLEATEVALSGLKSAWKRASQGGRLTVLLLGDSHVHVGHTAAVVRHELQEKFGGLGPGLVFPYSTAKLYAPAGYSTKHFGIWTTASTFRIPPKMPVGVQGIAARTEQPDAAVQLHFDPPLERGKYLVRVWCDRAAESFDVSVEAGGQVADVSAAATSTAATEPLQVAVRDPGADLLLRVVQRRPQQNHFELRGLSIEREASKGALVHTAGLGGSRYRALLHAERLKEQIRDLAPDVIVVEWGTNDILYDDAVAPTLESDVRQGLRDLRAAAPVATIVVVPPQDLVFRGKTITATPELAALLRAAAAKEGGAFWDWLAISGGTGQIQAWQKAGLARTDLIHLTASGYRKKGELLWLALRAAAVSVPK